jgi:cellulose biosynthesis protein BcsQ
MLTYTVYSEAGGVGKTTLAGNLAVADARAGNDVLAIDMDPQEGSLSYLFDVADERTDSEADSLVRHLVERPRGKFRDLVAEAEGVDIVPAHNSLEVLSKHLRRREEEAADFGENWNPNVQLLRVLKAANVPAEYDTVVIDPPATADVKLYNAIHATRNLVIPFEPSGKGQQSVTGLADLVDGLEDTLDINVGVLAAVPNRYKGTNDQETVLEELRSQDYDVPVVFRERTSLLEGCWRQQCSAFEYVESHRSRKRDYELETLEQFEKLAKQLHSPREQEATA